VRRYGSGSEDSMKTRTKIWLGVGVAVMTGTGAAQAGPTPHDPLASAQTPAAGAANVVLAARKGGGEAGEAGEEGGPKGAKSSLPPELDFALKLSQIRGHLLVGDELVRMGEWNAANPHFAHPGKELYAPIRGRLKAYKIPPFEAALRELANAVKARKGGDDYAKAWAKVDQALTAAEAAVKDKQANWPAFELEAAIELAKSAADEYRQSIKKGRVANAVEYQDARGFIWQAEKMIESVAPALEKKDADALAKLRQAFADLKKDIPSPVPPQTPPAEPGKLLGDVARLELAAGKLM
jgi:hypothetical protein